MRIASHAGELAIECAGMNLAQNFWFGSGRYTIRRRMSNPLATLAPAINVLSELDVLPATGGAFEDLLTIDPDELDDVIQNPGNEVAEFAETDPEPGKTDLYRNTPPKFRKQDHLYRYFIDGSIRTYHLGTGVEEGRTFPILLSQIGGACVSRNDEGRVHIHDHKLRLLLLVPFSNGYGLSDFTWKRLQSALKGSALLELADTTKESLPQRAIERGLQNALRDRAGGIARAGMHDLEVDLIQSTQRDSDKRLILDGGIRSGKFTSESHIIAVAKSFRKDVIFTFGGKRTNSQTRNDITRLLMNLKCFHRTVAFVSESNGGRVAFWYVRMRAQDEVDYPLKGVVKVELALNDNEKITAAEADRISSALVAERNVTPYGKDNRWHCHIYPIYQAEQAIKSRFFSNEVLLGSIRWNIKPKLNIAP